jgi:hypothetical protein
MPTYRHIPTGKRLLFIHIPRTAGRFLEKNLELNGFEVEQTNIWKSVEGIEVAHFHRELYEKYFDIKNIPHITVIRNPIDRFFSNSIFIKRMYGDDIENLLEDEMYFHSVLRNFPLSQSANWFREQVDFISDKTHIWKFENKFDKDFSKWISKIIDIPFKVYDVPYEKLSTDEENKVSRTARIISNVKELYRRDLEQLYSELAAPLPKGAETKT